MTQFQCLWVALSRRLPHDSEQRDGESEDATVKMAEIISRQLFGHELTKDEKRWAGPAVHYSFGALVGAVYGLAVYSVPEVKSGHGLAYGSAVWLAADEVGMAAAGFAEAPSQKPADSHAKGFASHLVYGITLEQIRRALLRVGEGSVKKQKQIA